MRKNNVILLSVLLVVVLSIGVLAAEYNEAPMLREKVENGELPAVEERLPEKPLVVTPRDSVGQYGGTLRTTHTKMFEYTMYEPLIVKDPYDNGKFKENLAESWEVSDDSTVFTFKLRKGLKWSDGVEFTSEDIMFWWEDRILNDEVEPIALPGWLKANDESCEVSAPDKYTVVFTFPAPKPEFLDLLATSIQYEGGINPSPKHYLKQFHPRYTSKEELDKRVKEAGLDSWFQLFEEKVKATQNPDLPTMYPFNLTTDPTSQLQIGVRNPYYFKVDNEGNQLPYIDDVKWQEITDAEVRIMKAMGGEVDLSQVSSKTSDIPVLKQSEAEGNYTTVLNQLSFLNGAGIVLNFNQNYTGNEEIAKLLRNTKFRIAMSLATNREEINEFTAMGLAQIRQATLNEGHPLMTKELAQKYTQHQPSIANSLLDEIGLDKKDKDGFRLLPNGESFTLVLSPPSNSSTRVDTATIIEPQWEDVGIKVVVKAEESSIWREKRESGEHQINVYGNTGAWDIMGGKAGYYFPVTNWNHFAPLNGRYYTTNGEGGLKPEGKLAELMNLYNAISKESNIEKRQALVKEAVELHLDELWQIGIIGYSPWPAVVHNRVKNVQKEFQTSGWHPLFPDAEQYWIDSSVPVK